MVPGRRKWDFFGGRYHYHRPQKISNTLSSIQGGPGTWRVYECRPVHTTEQKWTSQIL